MIGIYYYYYYYYYMTLEGLHYSTIGANVGRAILGLKFDITNGRAEFRPNIALPTLAPILL
jgi:hypothetical protein